jgi:hypothetical protein
LFCRKNASGKTETQYSGEEFAQNIMPMESGHFGLTILNAEMLKKVPHPWLQCIPNKDGVWENGKTDSDIGFWNKLREAGGNVFLAPHVVIGHLAEMVLWPDEKMSIRPQASNEYTKTGRPPAWVWK